MPRCVGAWLWACRERQHWGSEDKEKKNMIISQLQSLALLGRISLKTRTKKACKPKEKKDLLRET